MNLVGNRHIYFPEEEIFVDGGRMSPVTVMASNMPTRESWRVPLNKADSRELSPYGWLMRHEWLIKDVLYEPNRQ